MDERSPLLRKYQAECRRVGVSEAELQQIFRTQLDAWFKEHPDVRLRLKQEYPNLETDYVAQAFSPEIALEVLAALPDGAGTGAYLTRLEALQQERGWSPL